MLLGLEKINIKNILTEDALTISEEGAGALTRHLVLQGLETFTILY